MQYHYSIIIPHYNSPELLLRCLRSIPIREDIQVIVVDDCSPGADKYLSLYPELSRPFLELYSTAKGGSAGRARNVGLQHATGKWLVFADSDDYFDEGLGAFLDVHVDAQEDMIYFKPRPENEDFFPQRIKDIYYLFDCADESLMRFHYITPWGKLIKRELVEKNQIRFSEVRWGNDAFFVTQCAVLAKAICKTSNTLYVVMEREGSLTHTTDQYFPETQCRLHEDIKCYNFAVTHKFKPIDEALYSRCRNIINDRHLLLFARVYKSLPSSIKPQIRKRITHGLNMTGRLLYNLLFFLSHFTSKLPLDNKFSESQ